MEKRAAGLRSEPPRDVVLCYLKSTVHEHKPPRVSRTALLAADAALARLALLPRAPPSPRPVRRCGARRQPRAPDAQHLAAQHAVLGQGLLCKNCRLPALPACQLCQLCKLTRSAPARLVGARLDLPSLTTASPSAHQYTSRTSLRLAVPHLPLHLLDAARASATAHAGLCGTHAQHPPLPPRSVGAGSAFCPRARVCTLPRPRRRHGASRSQQSHARAVRHSLRHTQHPPHRPPALASTTGCAHMLHLWLPATPAAAHRHPPMRPALAARLSLSHSSPPPFPIAGRELRRNPMSSIVFEEALSGAVSRSDAVQSAEERRACASPRPSARLMSHGPKAARARERKPPVHRLQQDLRAAPRVWISGTSCSRDVARHAHINLLAVASRNTASAASTARRCTASGSGIMQEPACRTTQAVLVENALTSGAADKTVRPGGGGTGCCSR